MGPEYDIVVLDFEVDNAQAAKSLRRVFDLSASEATALLDGLPRVVKHRAPGAIADRYADALRAIGAVVECRKILATTARIEPRRDAMSLPTPNLAAAGLAHSWHAEEAGERAIERFRAAEGLIGGYSLPPIDLRNPRIPKAPLVPHDLARMPNAHLPIWSDPPGWSVADSLSTSPTDFPSSPTLPEAPLSSGAVFAADSHWRDAPETSLASASSLGNAATRASQGNSVAIPGLGRGLWFACVALVALLALATVWLR